MSQLIVALGLILPVAYALARAGMLGREDYLFNAGRTSFVLTLASIVSGNIGIGSFVALLVFTSRSPIIGFGVVLAYCTGLVLCAVFARRIHAAARATGSYGLVDYLCNAHGLRNPFVIWVPVAVVFGLRTVVQLLALTIIVQITFGLGTVAALGVATLVVGGYTAIGGYRVATETDLPQVLVMMLGVGAIAAALIAGQGAIPPGAPAFADFGPWSPGFLGAILVFLPFSAVLAIDNWQRIATADTPENARRAFLAAALICAPLFLTMAWVGWISGVAGSSDMATVIATFRDLVPFGWAVLADLAIMVAVMSSIDTFVMPLMTPMARTRLGLWQIRAAVMAVVAGLGLLAWAMGDIVVSIISAFNTLVVFLPAVFGALFLGDRAPRAAAVSMLVGVALTLVLSVVALQVAGVLGFAISAAIYTALRRRAP